ncbi:hypothetical protein, partial [Chryseobacterium sp. CH1]|uniref:hypothetical protein n=1 Tax=Chryseobacterium sp. CH1 TaxID=713551 RepID=UPI001E3F3550
FQGNISEWVAIRKRFNNQFYSDHSFLKKNALTSPSCFQGNISEWVAIRKRFNNQFYSDHSFLKKNALTS